MCNICDNIKNKSYLLTESNREELKIEFINKIDDFVVNQYYINCATENGTIGLSNSILSDMWEKT